MSELPQKEFYKLNEVCRYTDTQPYVLRFWESEFPQLNPEKSGSGQPVYRKEDIDLVRRIKQLLYEEECSLEVARQALDDDKKPGRPARKQARPTEEASAPAESSAVGRLRREAEREPPIREVEVEHVAPPSHSESDGLVPRQRYDDAVEEVHHLRRQLKEAETARGKAETALEAAADDGERYRRKAERASARIEQLLETLS